MSQILSHAAKSSLYHQNDGTGRDTYVSFNNGGNTIMYVPNAKNITVGLMRQSSSGYLTMEQGNANHSPPRTIHYDTNGTGRDTYIAHCDGGLH